MAVQKCEIILLQPVLKDFWSSANLKLKKLRLSKLSLLQDHTEENARIGVSKDLLLFSSIAPQWVFRKRLNFEGLQTYERHENHLIMS